MRTHNMIGFLFGTAALVGLTKAARGRDCGGHDRGCGRGFRRHGHHGHHGCWEEGGSRGERRSRFGRGMLRGVFERLETSPGQEKVMLDALEAVRGAAEKLRGEAGQTRSELTRAMRGEHFNAATVKDGFTRQDALLAELRGTVLGELSRVHEALDERQRRELADLVDRFGDRFGERHGGGFGARFF